MTSNFTQFTSWRTIQYRSHSLIHFFLNEIDSEERIFPCIVAFKPNSVVELFKSPRHGFLRTCGHLQNSKFAPSPILGAPAAHRIFIFMPHMKIFFHFVTFREVLFCLLRCGLPRALFESHFVIFGYEVHRT